MSRVAAGMVAGFLALAAVAASAQESLTDEQLAEEADYRELLGELLEERLEELKAEGMSVEPLPQGWSWEGAAPLDPHQELWVGRLAADAAGSSAVQSFELSDDGHSYLVMAVCDEDCLDIDLALVSGDGEVLESDHEEDAEPVLVPGLYDGGLPAGSYAVGLAMYNCQAAYCYYAVGIYRFLDE